MMGIFPIWTHYPPTVLLAPQPNAECYGSIPPCSLTTDLYNSRETIRFRLRTGPDLSYIYEWVHTIETHNNRPINPILPYALDLGVV
jgi:hypothetical protein